MESHLGIVYIHGNIIRMNNKKRYWGEKHKKVREGPIDFISSDYRPFSSAVRYLSSSSGISSISSVVGLATGIPSRRLTMSSRSVPTSLVAATWMPLVISW